MSDNCELYKDNQLNMDNKYLLYIDILGFSDMVKNDYGKIVKLFDYIDNLNVHRHDAFQTIVFSDTILIFNKETPLSTHDHENIVMFACEFVQDLMCQSVDLEVQFRAILTYGEFSYERLTNIDSYHGIALVNAYNKEKEINGIGLFLDKKIAEYNTIFKTTPFDKDLYFVFVTQSLERLHKYDYDIPISRFSIENELVCYDIEWESKILRTIRKNIDTQIDSRIRGKYIQTYYIYKQRYQKIIGVLEENDFDYKILSPDAEWENSLRT